jgi:hypothetical protein
MYKLDEEPPLRFSMMAIMDGNQSLRLVDYMFRGGSERPDGHSARSDIWLSQEEVDTFKDEVHKVDCKDFDVTV